MLRQNKKLAGPEIWRDIKGTGGLYQVSTCGRVRSAAKGKIIYLKPLYDARNRAGYVRLYYGGKQWKSSVQRLVYEAFIDELKPGQCIVHKNCDTFDDSVWNLTVTDRHGLGKYASTRHEYKCVELLDDDGNPIAVYRNCELAGQDNYYSGSQVRQHCLGNVLNPKFRYEKTKEK